MDIKIIGSGSSGNAILFEGSILVDAGMPYKNVEKYANGINAVLLSHKHGDHIKATTIRKLHIANEKIKFCCAEFLKATLEKMGLPEKNIVVVESGKNYKISGITFSPIDLFHDIPNIGYRLLFADGHKHIIATDTAHLQGITAKGYDSACIECNHEINAAIEIIEQKRKEREFSHLKRTINTHLSVDKAIKFITENNIKQFYPVHMGSSTQDAVNKALFDAEGCFELMGSNYESR